LKPEQGAEREPKINLKFFFAAHTKPADWEKLAELIEKADIYAVESWGLEKEQHEEYNRVSLGEVSPSEAESRIGGLDARVRKEFEAIYNSRKPVVFVDVPAGHPLNEESSAVWKLRKLAIDRFKSGEFESAAAKERAFIEGYRGFQEEREEYVRSEIKNLVEKLKSDREFKNKSEINVLVRFGVAHIGLSRSSYGEGVESAAVFGDLPYVFSFGGEAFRRLSFKGSMPEELLARSLMEEVLARKLNNFADSTQILVKVLRRIISKLTIDDIREISLAMGRGEDVVSAIEARGVKVPKSKEEMEERAGKTKAKAL